MRRPPRRATTASESGACWRRYSREALYGCRNEHKVPPLRFSFLIGKRISGRDDSVGRDEDVAGDVKSHEKLHFFSRRSEKKSRLTTMTSMPSEIAAPSGQLYAAPNKLTTMLELMTPLGPPSSSGARKSPRLKTKAKVAPATTPGIDSGKITFQKVCVGVAPRSCEASTRLRGMCSSEA